MEKKDEWLKLKNAEKIWKEVKVYNSTEMEQWLDNTLSVSRWLAAQDGINTYPFDGITTADEFWEEWSIGPKGLILLPEILISGREHEKELLLNALEGAPTIKGVKASSKNEAIAFIIASAKTFRPDLAERFFSKTLIVDTEGNFRGIRINTNTEVNLIPRFEDAEPLYAAVSRGHHVLVPLGADDDFNQETIFLPSIDREGQISSLIKSGLSKDEAEKKSKEAGRNITILKKLLGFPYFKAKWFKKENIREIIPALLIGRWNESYEGDIELIEKLSGQKYNDYLIILNKWKIFEESPILQIGETWRLTSPLDLWTNLSNQLTTYDFQKIKECILQAFKSINSVYKSDDKTNLFSLSNQKTKYSNWSREGLIQSLILISQMNIPHFKNPQNWVDNIIFDLLNEASGEMWITLNSELPFISEASPEVFLNAVKISLNKEKPEVMEMFKEYDGFLHKTSHHTGLLWALENLAWIPEYLRDTSLILLKLSKIDPGGSLINRPLNSIIEIFKPWHYQTFSSYTERIEILKYVTDIEKESGWNLLINLLPNHRETSFGTHKMRWRMFDNNTYFKYTYEEMWNTHSQVIEILLRLVDSDELKFSQIIKEIPNLKPNDRKKVLEWAIQVNNNIIHEKNITWHTIRQVLSYQRTYKTNERSMTVSELSELERLFNVLEPINIIDKYIWLFNTSWPEFPEGSNSPIYDYDNSHERRKDRIEKERKKAILYIIKDLGLSTTLELRKQIKEIGSFGFSLADVVSSQKDILKVCECLYDDEMYIGFVQNFFNRISIKKGFRWICSFIQELQSKKLDNKVIINILIALKQNQEFWNFVASLEIEIQNLYWEKINPNFYQISDNEKISGINLLLKHRRFCTVLKLASQFPAILQSEQLSDILIKAVNEKANETPFFSAYEIEKIFEELDKRSDLDKSTRVNLEWCYLPLLDSRKRKNLEDALTENPDFFVEILKCIYISDEEFLVEKEIGEILNETNLNRAKHAFNLINSWKKIPGMKDDNSIDEEFLKNWIKKVRTLAKSINRLRVADAEIGKLLAQYPENDILWPQEIIFELIEEIKTESLIDNYSSELFNKRGLTSRSTFEGGNIERENAAYFENLEIEFKNKYPSVSEIFKNLKVGYLLEAVRMDNNAERMKLEY